LLCDELTPRAYFELLRERELYIDAIRFLARALPKRLGVWWGCLCAWHVAGPGSSPEVLAALRAAVRWVLDPSEENRRAAEGPGLVEDFATAASCLAMAAHWSGGSMLRPELPVVSPPEDVTAKLVTGAIQRAVVQRGFAEARDHYRQFLAMGAEIARGQNLWADVDVDARGLREERDRPIRPLAETFRPLFDSTTIDLMSHRAGPAVEQTAVCVG
jgi:hypothetical protein